MWTALFMAIAQRAGGGEVWKLGEPQEATYPSCAIRRMPEFPDPAGFDAVFNRGGYPEYEPILDRVPRSVYYGAGKRWCPARRHDVILVDTWAQAAIAQGRWPDSRVIVFHKPAAPCFAPKATVKQFDIVWVCSNPRPFKGADWLVRYLPQGSSVLRIGSADPWFLQASQDGRLKVEWIGKVRPKHIPPAACQAAAGVVCDDGTCDSGPRVLPELLAMDIPVIVRRTVRCDVDAYVTRQTGEMVDGPDLPQAMASLRARASKLAPREHYAASLSIGAAAESVIQCVPN